jgi:hypothetical protein
MLTFQSDLPAFAIGRRVNMEEWNTFTRTYEDDNDSDRLGFGVPVKSGTGKHTCVAITAADGQVVLGITEAMPNMPRPGDGYARYDNVPVCEYGVIAVAVTGNTTKDAAARWDTAAGKWTAAAESGTVVTIPGATFEETATAPGIAPVRWRRPNPSTSSVA